MISLSLACPAYNESGHIYNLLKEWHQFLSTKAISFEIVICNDGSKDNTWAEIQRAEKDFGSVKGVNLIQNQGAGFAMAEAIFATTGEIVVTTDSDGQFKIEDAFAFYEMLKGSPETDSVSGVRQRKVHSLGSRVGTRYASSIANFLLSSKFPDFNCALKATRGNLIRSFPFEAKGLNYSTELSYWLHLSNARIMHQPVIQHNRVSGMSSAKFFRTSRDRFLFLLYLAFKRKLNRKKILKSVH